MVFRVFLGISRYFAEIPEFRGSATAQNIRSPEIKPLAYPMAEGKLDTGSRVHSFSHSIPSSTDVPVLLLNQPNISVKPPTQYRHLIIRDSLLCPRGKETLAFSPNSTCLIQTPH